MYGSLSTLTLITHFEIQTNEDSDRKLFDQLTLFFNLLIQKTKGDTWKCGRKIPAHGKANIQGLPLTFSGDNMNCPENYNSAFQKRVNEVGWCNMPGGQLSNRGAVLAGQMAKNMHSRIDLPIFHGKELLQNFCLKPLCGERRGDLN